MTPLLALIVLLVLFGVIGGLAITKFLFFVLIVAALLALIGLLHDEPPKDTSPQGGHVMGLGVSLILIAVGAVMAWAVHVSTSGFNVHTVGYILLIVGVIGALLSLVFWSSWAGPGTSLRVAPVGGR